MPRNKVLEKAKVSLPSGRNAFDCSQERAQTSLCGEIDVAYCHPFVAGSKVHLNRANFTRTAQVVSPAFHRVTEHYDFFCVPLHSIWSQWENWKLNINDLKNTLTVPWDSANGAPNLNLPSNAPRMNFTALAERLGYLDSSFTADSVRKANDAVKLCDWLRYGAYNACLQTGASPAAKVMNLFSIAAYQKCYFEHYRNTAYENNNPYAFNFDWLYDGTHNGLLNPNSTTSGASNQQDDYVARELFKIRRVNYRNDYFHNIYPALNYVNTTPLGNWYLPSGVSGASVQGFNSEHQPMLAGIQQTLQPSVAVFSGSTSGGTPHSVSVQQIRSLFALDRLMRAAAYAPKHVREQYKAQYGVDGVEDFDMQSERIGSFESSVQFQEVTNMAETSFANIGQLGAKGLGGSGNEKGLDYYCKYDSIIICLHYFLPRARYDNLGIQPWNAKIAREDFYIRAFENLGLRPFYGYNINMGHTQANTAIGWTVANFEYKILPDLNFGAFKQFFEGVIYNEASGSTPATWTINTGLSNELSTFVPHNNAVKPSLAITAEYFKVAPEDLDNIFAVATPSDHNVAYYQFFTDMRISVSVVMPMGIHGQPTI